MILPRICRDFCHFFQLFTANFWHFYRDFLLTLVITSSKDKLSYAIFDYRRTSPHYIVVIQTTRHCKTSEAQPVGNLLYYYMYSTHIAVYMAEKSYSIQTTALRVPTATDKSLSRQEGDFSLNLKGHPSSSTRASIPQQYHQIQHRRIWTSPSPFLYNQRSCCHDDTDPVCEARLLRLRSKYLEPDSSSRQQRSFCPGFSQSSKDLFVFGNHLDTVMHYRSHCCR